MLARSVYWLFTAVITVATVWTVNAVARGDTLSIDDAQVRAMPATADVTAAYLVIHNYGSSDEILVGIRSSDFARSEIHATATVDGRMNMRQLSSVEIPAHGSLAFRQGSLHIMLYQPSRSLRPGEVVKLTLEFSSGRSLSVDAQVRDMRQVNDQDHH